MKKLIISALALAAIATAPAHAINAKYREQLIRSGCTTENAGTTCDIHKTKAQNAAAAKKGGFAAFAGKYDVLDASGKKISVVTVTATSVKIDGRLVEEPKLNGSTLIFHVQAAYFTLVNNQFGNWVNTAQSQNGSIERQK